MREKELKMLGTQLEAIEKMGWIKNRRPGNVGGVGNTLEDLLEVAENNLQLPDLGDWELKSQRADSASLMTLFHMEPNLEYQGLFHVSYCQNMDGHTRKLVQHIQQMSKVSARQYAPLDSVIAVSK